MNRDKDAKRQVLRKNGTLNPRLDRVKSELFTDNEFFDAADLMQIKYEMVRAAEQQGRPISKVAKEFGLSRPAFYHAQQAFREQGLAGLLPRKRGPKSSYKLTGEALAFVEQQAERKGCPNTTKLAETITERFGVCVHPRTVQRALHRLAKKKHGTRSGKQSQRRTEPK